MKRILALLTVAALLIVGGYFGLNAFNGFTSARACDTLTTEQAEPLSDGQLANLHDKCNPTPSSQAGGHDECFPSAPDVLPIATSKQITLYTITQDGQTQTWTPEELDVWRAEFDPDLYFNSPDSIQADEYPYPEVIRRVRVFSGEELIADEVLKATASSCGFFRDSDLPLVIE